MELSGERGGGGPVNDNESIDGSAIEIGEDDRDGCLRDSVSECLFRVLYFFVEHIAPLPLQVFCCRRILFSVKS